MKIYGKTSKKFLFIAIFAFCFLINADSVKACLCFSPTDAVWAFDDSENVGIFQIQSVEKYREGEKGYGYKGYKQAVLTVLKVYKGKMKVGDSFALKQGGGDCIVVFDEDFVGKEMLLYLGKKPNKNELWEIYICSRSQMKKSAMADIYYLDKMKKLQGKTRISGVLTKRIRPSFKGENGSFEVLSGINVNIRGKGKNINLKTDKNGVYEIYDLPLGKYVVTTEKPNGFKLSEFNSSNDVELDEEDQESVDFNFEVDNRISGTIFDAEGKFLKNVCVEMLPIFGEKPKSYELIDCTDENGSFRFDEIPPGNYVIQIEKEAGKDSANAAEKTFYYPNALKREEAAQINVGIGTIFENFNIKIP